MVERFDDFAVVLCRAEGSSNVGAICRAMKTMGFGRLVLADCPEYDLDAVHTSAIHAFDLFEAAERHASLASALSGFTLAAGFTRRLGRYRKKALELGRFADDCMRRSAGRIALVFGNERDGLSAAELDLCDEAVFIPTADAFPSLNLSHAVQLACWELRKAVTQADPSYNDENGLHGRMPALRGRIAVEVETVCVRLEKAGFFKIGGRQDAAVLLNSVLARSAATEKEVRQLRNMFFKLAVLDSDLE
ncbi:MAG: RNA methyltransferase [Spirochaetota bacterium]